jgi:autotransporter-associated beta strand protein
MGFGSRLIIDLYSDGHKADQMNTAKLIVETKDWKYGPTFKQPVITFDCHFASGEEKLAIGQYDLGTVNSVEGDIDKIKIEGIVKVKASLAIENGHLFLNVEGTRDATDIEWNASQSNVWDVATTENFVTHDAVRATETFIEDDNVYFTDNSQNKNVVIADGTEVKAANIYCTGSEAYTFSGAGKIVEATFHHSGSGSVTMGNANTYTGGNHLTGGTTIVKSLSNATQAYGNLGGVTTSASLFTIENGATLQNTAAVSNGSAMRMIGRGVIHANASFTQQGNIIGDTLVKAGAGTLTMSGNLSASRTIVREGNMTYSGSNYTKTVELQGSSSIAGNGFIPTPLYVAKGAKSTLTLTSTYYQAYSGALTGSGQLTINSTNTVNRVAITGNWTKFEGTIVYNNTSILMPLKNSGMPLATLSTGANTNIGIATSSDNASVTYPIGKLTGSGTLHGKEVTFSNSNSVSGNVTWKVGHTDLGDFTFSGVIYDNGGNNKSNFEKVGDCKMTVAKSWENSGTVKVSEGRLAVNQSISLGTGALTVADGATLSALSSTIRNSSKSHGFTNKSITVDGALRCGSSDASVSGYL